ncbi:MAG: ATP-binding cassette domain-containing protein [Pedobacter sp.]|uniref:ATP-binding cassette domain-containing protein n=1 Tax=Pedobacter sp. TaxID=1411316 RepID=UPI0028083786|nr:ATP-binding cassette domain-containing protein [Pedobacter sp.]MDQ8005956.1 ATP-binding cassette domain-containing protein [Pedobacter sp.]
MSNPIVQISKFSLKYGHKAVLTDLDWTISEGENWLLTGASGSGKTALLKAIAGLEKSTEDIVVVFDKASDTKPVCQYIAQWYQFKNVEGVANFYYQQRYNVQQVKDTLTVNAELAHYGKENNLSLPKVEPILNALGFAALRNAQLIELSSGEHKKLQLVKALWLKPQLLLLDQPYTGLDIQSRQNLNTLLDDITSEGVQIILVSNETEIPTCINRYGEIVDGQLTEHFAFSSKSLIVLEEKEIPEFLHEAPTSSSETLIKMVDVNISYGEKQVLKNVNWEIKAGEKWLLQGHNGSGKSTLLSLINGDHPQAYANDIHLFGNKRGSGESIWDIKQHIGLISPELHWYFDFNATVWQSIASGFFDSIGLYKEIGWHKRTQVDELIEYFGLTANKNDLLSALPLGKQRLVLLARTVIKNPELLVLDEPCQGLDAHQTLQFNTLIDGLCTTNRTLIYVSHSDDQLPKNLTHQLLLRKGEVVHNDIYKNRIYKEELESVI